MLGTTCKHAAAVLVAVFTLSLVSCGGGAGASANKTVGPAGPTSPSAHYFDLTASPTVVKSTGTILFKVHVWDSSGKNASGVTVHFTGAPDAADVETTDLAGYATFGMDISGDAGATDTVTATVENKSLSVAFQILP